jgi:serine protease
MKCYLKLIPLVLLVGCAKGGGGGSMCAVSSVGGKNSAKTEEDSKALFTVQEISSSGSETFGLVGLESAEQGVKRGTELTVSVKESCQKYGPISGTIDRTEDLPTPSGVRDYTWVADRTYSSDELTEILEEDECVVTLSDSQAVDVHSLPTDPKAKDQDHFRALNAGDAYPILLNASSGQRPYEVIAVIDTGIDMNHPDLKDNLWVNPGEIAGNKVDDDKNGYVDDVNGYNFANKIGSPQYIGSTKHHGTFVSGLAAAKGGNGIGISGVMGHGAKIMALNVFGSAGSSYTSNSANAIRYAVDNGASIINLSLGGVGKSAAYESALDYAMKNGVTVLAAAGNERNQLGVNYWLSPAAYGSSFNGVISVGAVNSKDLSWAAYSNYSSVNVEIAAPGSENYGTGRGVLSTNLKNTYSRGHGTSYATPIAAGSAALAASMVRARGYAPNGLTIERVLTESAKSLSALASKVKSGRVLDLLSMAKFINSSYPQKATGPYRGKVGAEGYFNPGACL